MSRIHKLSRRGHGLIHVVHHLVAIETNARKRGQKMLHCSHSKLTYTRKYDALYYNILILHNLAVEVLSLTADERTGTFSAVSQ